MRRPTLAALAGIASATGIFFAAQAVAASGDVQIAQADPDDALLLEALSDEGERIYENRCASCHGDGGEGGAGPPFAGSEYPASNRAMVGSILGGFEDHGMPAFASILDDREVAAVSTYIRNAWGNDFGITTESFVSSQRGAD